MAHVSVERRGKVAWVGLNRPEKLNALNRDSMDELSAILDTLAADDSISVLVLFGEGRAFSVGADLGGTRPADRVRAFDDWNSIQHQIDSVWLKLWRFPKPTIAAVHGYVMGIAVGITVCTDVTVVAEDAVVGWPGVPLGGGMLGPASMWLIGPKKAKELSFTWGRMTGRESVEWGWANYALPEDQVLDKADALARRMAKTPLELLKVKKAALNRVLELQGFTTALMHAPQWNAIAHDSRAVEEWRSRIASDGLREALRRFASEDPADD